MTGLAAVILAAGKGTRMKSARPKVLHEVGGRPMVMQVLAAARQAGVDRSIVVVGFGAEQVEYVVGDAAEIVVQAEQLGTGHAVMQTQDALQSFDGAVMVLCGDTPLLRADTLQALFRQHQAERAAATVLTAHMPDPAGYGRIIRNGDGQVLRIVEQKDATTEELAVTEINTGIYCFEARSLFSALSGVDCQNSQNEYYLTDVIASLVAAGQPVGAIMVQDPDETMGINSRAQLSMAEKLCRRRKLEELMDAGVTIMDMDSTFVDATVCIGQDSIIYPFTWLEGETVIGANCRIGPHTRLENTAVGDETIIHFSYAHDCCVGSRATVGPYVHLRPDSQLTDGVKIGNFVEVKNSVIGSGSKVPHLSYIGDADIGSEVNIGCGTITVNYDGQKKHRTHIADQAFVGCNTNLVAPVSVFEGAYVAAGSTITKDVPPGALGVGRARQTNFPDWVKNRGAGK